MAAMPGIAMTVAKLTPIPIALSTETEPILKEDRTNGICHFQYKARATSCTACKKGGCKPSLKSC